MILCLSNPVCFILIISTWYTQQYSLPGEQVERSAVGDRNRQLWHDVALYPDEIQYIIRLPHTHGALQWRYNERDGVSNHQPHERLLNRLFWRRSKKTSKLHVTGLCAGNSQVTGEFPAQSPVTQKMFPFDDVIMWTKYCRFRGRTEAEAITRLGFVGWISEIESKAFAILDVVGIQLTFTGFYQLANTVGICHK